VLLPSLRVAMVVEVVAGIRKHRKTFKPSDSRAAVIIACSDCAALEGIWR